jgi:hypothetical protein
VDISHHRPNSTDGNRNVRGQTPPPVVAEAKEYVTSYTENNPSKQAKHVSFDNSPV